jgi:hypothetical protein
VGSTTGSWLLAFDIRLADVVGRHTIGVSDASMELTSTASTYIKVEDGHFWDCNGTDAPNGRSCGTNVNHTIVPDKWYHVQLRYVLETGFRQIMVLDRDTGDIVLLVQGMEPARTFDRLALMTSCSGCVENGAQGSGIIDNVFFYRR